MADTARVPGTPHEIALLAGGPRAAVTVAVVALHLRGAVEAGARATVVAVDSEAGRALPPLPPPEEVLALEDDIPAELRVPYLESAVYRRLHEPCDVREVLRDPDVQWAVTTLRIGLADTDMVSPPALGTTRAARRHVHALRTAYPLPASRAGLSDEAKLLAVALHGEAALRLVAPASPRARASPAASTAAARAPYAAGPRLRRRLPVTPAYSTAAADGKAGVAAVAAAGAGAAAEGGAAGAEGTETPRR
ncbi:TIGR04222 domain-containing membrane protein [Streptomyces sp. MMS20-AI2-20]|uniref:TIGR04222 domain-containing membrane protein n=1 Tax=Streptomyces sp. MMS20-AI2-20 TaxID=2925835 RepID=UPI001F60BB24|nr:TIGR04222 domain-containing membrane protein [Streptomyces sp. MMS20-AI2-20]MCI4140561.1 TIGR04222 domain-containing membrane protein [Streptomyces sp. MMS20-AI2-20]